MGFRHNVKYIVYTAFQPIGHITENLHCLGEKVKEVKGYLAVNCIPCSANGNHWRQCQPDLMMIYMNNGGVVYGLVILNQITNLVN